MQNLLRDPRLERGLYSAMRFFWALTLLTLPVTSFRYMPFFGSDSLVRPLALLPAATLMALLVVNMLRAGKWTFWHAALGPLVVFTAAAVFSTAVGLALAPADLYHHTFEGRALRAWVTLAVGIVFLLTSIAMNRSERDLRFSLNWLFAGFAVQLAWSLVQIMGAYVPNLIPGVNADSVESWQRVISATGTAYQRRISGLALEPSWLAAQLVTFYIPWLFASLLTGYRALRHAWLDALALLAALMLMLLTFSRGGYLTLVAATTLAILVVGRAQIAALWRWYTSPGHGGRLPLWVGWGLRAGILLGVLGAVAGILLVLRNNEYFEVFFQGVQAANLVEFFDQIYAGPRLAYVVAGWQAFAAHPWFGVGLGGGGFYLYQNLPEWAHFNNLEMARLLSPLSTVYPNTKNLFLRVLLETGLVGFWSLVSFYLGAFALAFQLSREKARALAFVGAAAVMALFAMLLYGFSLDSFALPMFWIPPGFLIGATSWVSAGEGETSKS